MSLNSVMTYGADAGTMLTGLAVATATWTWVRKQYRERQERKAQHSLRSWNGYVAPLSQWWVRVADDSRIRDGLLTLEVLDTETGPASPSVAAGMRIVVNSDRMLAQAPTPAQYEFIRELAKERITGGKPYPVR
jgi:hypothetical protein